MLTHFLSDFLVTVNSPCENIDSRMARTFMVFYLEDPHSVLWNFMCLSYLDVFIHIIHLA